MPVRDPITASSGSAEASYEGIEAQADSDRPQSQHGAEGDHDPSRDEVEKSKSETELSRVANRISEVDFQHEVTDEGSRPPLPPRPKNFDLLHPGGSLQRPTRPKFQSTPTTALSFTDIYTQSHQDGSRETFTAPVEPPSSGKSPRGFESIRKFKDWAGSEGDDSASIRSYAPTLETGGDVESLLSEVLERSEESSAWKILSSHVEKPDPFESIPYDDDSIIADFEQEFDELDELYKEGDNEGSKTQNAHIDKLLIDYIEQLLSLWKSKRKHFIILSSAGKPIYNRHGDDNLISGYIGIIQTVISFYENAKDRLKTFTAGTARFVVMAEGPLYLVAISKLGENEAQLRVQLEALYMQILSTLTLPTLTHLFSNRPSTDLRRPLQGTEPLLSALADTFTRGSPPTLLSALECLRIRKSHRQVINNTLLQKRCESLLYGLIVAGGRLVSVVRPRRHSLHPSDLQLIFNMLFEADGIKAGGGENWIPLCLPGFNKNGYLYMYVSFIDSADTESEAPDSETAHAKSGNHDEVAVLLISANKESFYDLRTMRDAVIQDLDANGSMAIIKSAVRHGRPSATDIVPGTVLHHFLYKSRANVQFAMPSYEPHFTTLLARRKLLSLYHTLHATVHAKNAHLKIHHCVSRGSVSLAWMAPLFELYCVAGPQASRNALAQSANKVLQWAQQEEERIFIIGGAVSNFLSYEGFYIFTDSITIGVLKKL